MAEEFDQFVDARIKVRADFLKEHLEPDQQRFDAFIKDFEAYAKALIRAKQTGNYKPVESKKIKVRESINQRNCPNTKIENNKPSLRNEIDTIKVKTEKLSNGPTSVENFVSEEMPAPKMIPKKRQVKKEKEFLNVKATRGRDNSESKRSTRSNASRSGRNSDVIIQNTPHPVVELSDSEEEKIEAPIRSTRTRTKKQANPEEIASTTMRSTRTRTKNKIASDNESNVAEEAKSTLGSEDETDVQSTNKSNNRNVVEIKKEAESPVKFTRITRTKTKAKPKRERSGSEVGNLTSTMHKRSKSDSKTDTEQPSNTSGHTEYEDAVSDVENRPENSTFVLPNKPTKTRISQKENSTPPMDQTVVMEKSNNIQPQPANHVDDLLTDDESIEVQQLAVSPQKSKKAKEVFSPYDSSPVKKKVEAFEKFQQHDAMGSCSKANTSRILREIEENKGNVKEKARGFTPVSSKTFKGGPPSSSKIGKYVGSKTMLNDSSSSFSKYTPVKLTKSSGADYREKELRRIDKERELKKQEMLKRMATEERKKRYEEKMLKVQQQQKEAIEKEKQKAIEAQRQKEERYKLLMQQKEEKQRQLREENEKKRLVAKKRAEEKRKQEELLQQEKLKNDQMRKKTEDEDLRKTTLKKTFEKSPIYMTRPAPLMECDDCHDSDDENYSTKRKLPPWATKYNVYVQDKHQTYLGHRLKNTLYCCQNQSVDLVEVFEKIDPKKLKRSSSAYWKKPPRFTMLPVNEEENYWALVNDARVK